MNQNPDKKHFLHAVIPSKAELVVIPIVTTLYLVLSTAITRARSADSNNYSLVSELIDTRLRSGLERIDNLIGSTIPTLFFWMFIGLLVYTLIWFMTEAFNAYKNDVPMIKGMVVPQGYSQSGMLRAGIARVGLRAMSAVLFIVWTVYFFTRALPYASTVFLENSFDFGLENISNLGLAVFALAGSIFIFIVLARLVVLRDRVFG